MAKERLTKPRTLLDKWARMAGFHRRALSSAAELLSGDRHYIWRRHVGRASITRVDKLAMTAALFDLPEFSEAMYDLPPAHLETARAAASVLRKALAGDTIERASAPALGVPPESDAPHVEGAPG